MSCSDLQTEYFKSHGQARRDAWEQMSWYCQPYTWVRHKLRRTKRLFQSRSRTGCYVDRTDINKTIKHTKQPIEPRDGQNLVWLTEEQCEHASQKKKEKESSNRSSVSASTRRSPSKQASKSEDPIPKQANVCIQIKKYGVLGGRGNEEPRNKSIVIVDPAGPPFLKNNSRGASGASASIYNYLDHPTFPRTVLDGFEPFDAKYHKYNTPNGFVHVIHTVGPYGPDFRGHKFDFFMTSRLTIVYENIFKEFIKSKQDTLRLLRVSSGIFADNQDLTTNTYEALAAALKNLTHDERAVLASKTIEMCLLTHDNEEVQFHKDIGAMYGLCAI